MTPAQRLKEIEKELAKIRDVAKELAERKALPGEFANLLQYQKFLLREKRNLEKDKEAKPEDPS